MKNETVLLKLNLRRRGSTMSFESSLTIFELLRYAAWLWRAHSHSPMNFTPYSLLWGLYKVQRLSLLLLLLSFPLSLQAFGRFAPQRARVSSMHLSSSKYSLTSQWGVHEWVRVRVREFACECVFLDEHSASIRTQQNKWIVTKNWIRKNFAFLEPN